MVSLSHSLFLNQSSICYCDEWGSGDVGFRCEFACLRRSFARTFRCLACFAPTRALACWQCRKKVRNHTCRGWWVRQGRRQNCLDWLSRPKLIRCSVNVIETSVKCTEKASHLQEAEGPPMAWLQGTPARALCGECRLWKELSMLTNIALLGSRTFLSWRLHS